VSQVQLNDNRYALLAEIKERGEPQTFDDLVGTNGLERDMVWKELIKLWHMELVEVQTPALPFGFGLTSEGERRLRAIEEGASISKMKGTLDSLAAQFGDLKIIKDPSQSKRHLVVPYADDDSDDLDLHEARWVYESGVIRRPEEGDDVKALTEEEAA
jgi:hypothetical protein